MIISLVLEQDNEEFVVATSSEHSEKKQYVICMSGHTTLKR